MPMIDEQAVKNAFAEFACMSPGCCDLYITAAMDLTKRMIKDELADIQKTVILKEGQKNCIVKTMWKNGIGSNQIQDLGGSQSKSIINIKEENYEAA